MTIDAYIVNRAARLFPAGATSVLSSGYLAARPGLRARSAAHAALKTAQQHLANVDAAAKYQDPEISPDMLPELRRELSDTIKRQTEHIFGNPLDGLVHTAERAHTDADTAAEKHRLSLDPESTAQLVRTDQAWNNVIKPALAAGKNWDQIIPTLDNDGLLAAERFASGHESSIRDRFHQHEVPSVIEGIKTMSERRMIENATPEVREVLREAQDTASALEFVRTAAGVVSEANGLNAVTLGLGLKRGAYSAGAQNPVDTSDEGIAAYSAHLQSSPSSPAQAA